jgi:hypothetical protein
MKHTSSRIVTILVALVAAGCGGNVVVDHGGAGVGGAGATPSGAAGVGGGIPSGSGVVTAGPGVGAGPGAGGAPSSTGSTSGSESTGTVSTGGASAGSGGLGGMLQDSPGDVTYPPADVLSGAIYVADGQVDIRIQFAAKPFTSQATEDLNIAIDRDFDPSTGDTCGQGSDVCPLISREHIHSNHLVLYVKQHMHDLCSQTTYDSMSHTIRFVVPESWLGTSGGFGYWIGVSFGGSGGANESAPDDPSFSAGRFYTAIVAEPPPFTGQAWCN